MLIVEAAAVLLTLVSVILTVYENIWCWPTAIVGVALYGILFQHERLYADMGLQAIYIVLSVYGWYEWLHGGEARSELKVSNAPLNVQAISYAVGGALSIVLALILRRTTNAALPFVDSTLTSYSLVAQWLMTKKYIENWIIWIAVDVVYVAMFIYKRLYMTAGLYFVFMFLCMRGYMEWKRSREVVVAASR